MDKLQPLLLFYENVKGAAQRSKDESGNFHRPAVEEPSLINMYIFYLEIQYICICTHIYIYLYIYIHTFESCNIYIYISITTVCSYSMYKAKSIIHMYIYIYYLFSLGWCLCLHNVVPSLSPRLCTTICMNADMLSSLSSSGV